MDTLIKIATIASVVITALILVLNAIAPLTKTEWDNKAVNGLRWFQDTVLKLILPQHDVTVKPVEKTPVAPAKE